MPVGMADIRDLVGTPQWGRGSFYNRRPRRSRPRRAVSGRWPRLAVSRNFKLALVAGGFLGLAISEALPRPQADPFAEYRGKAVPSPWADSEISRAILARQEGAPRSALRETERGGADRARIERGGTAHVIDGDTFRVGGDKIRIAGIDTPEVAARCAAEADLAARATARTRELLAGGGWEMHAAGGPDRDRYGRKLRTVTKNGRSIGDTLVSEGLARPYDGGRRAGWC